jgi:hypothetical protein
MPFPTYVPKLKSASLPNININNETTVNSAPMNIPAQTPTSNSSNNNIEAPTIPNKCQPFAPPLPNAVITQSQTTVNSTVESNNNLPLTQTELPSTTQQPNNTSPPVTNNSDCNNNNSLPVETAILLHHENRSHYVLSQYCLPVEESTDQSSADICKFGDRLCLIKRYNILSTGQNLSSLSSTVYSPNPKDMKQNKLSVMDTRLVECFNPDCKESKTSDIPKIFHHVCFMKSLTLKINQGMLLLQLENNQDPLIKYIKNASDDIQSKLTILLETGIPVIFPVCSKKCWKHVNGYRALKIKKGLSGKKEKLASSVANWDNDGGEGIKSSTEIVIDWLTCEENASSYFGGVDRKGRTNANRKEAYHNLLSILIHKENSKYIHMYS